MVVLKSSFRAGSNGGVSLYGSLPVLAIKCYDVDIVYSAGIQASVVDPSTVRVGTRSVETLHPTLGTESVLGFVGVKGVARQMLFTLNGR